MSWYELLLTLHILAIATWFGSNAAITAMGFMSARTGPEAFGTFVLPAAKWARIAHPAAGVVLLLTGFAMVADRNLDFDLWLILAVIGLVAAMGIGGGMIGRTSEGMVKRIEAGSMTAEELTDGSRTLLLWTRIELAILVLVIVDMVVKPGA